MSRALIFFILFSLPFLLIPADLLFSDPVVDRASVYFDTYSDGVFFLYLLVGLGAVSGAGISLAGFFFGAVYVILALLYVGIIWHLTTVRGILHKRYLAVAAIIAVFPFLIYSAVISLNVRLNQEALKEGQDISPVVTYTVGSANAVTYRLRLENVPLSNDEYNVTIQMLHESTPVHYASLWVKKTSEGIQYSPNPETIVNRQVQWNNYSVTSFRSRDSIPDPIKFLVIVRRDQRIVYKKEIQGKRQPY